MKSQNELTAELRFRGVFRGAAPLTQHNVQSSIKIKLSIRYEGVLLAPDSYAPVMLASSYITWALILIEPGHPPFRWGALPDGEWIALANGIALSLLMFYLFVLPIGLLASLMLPFGQPHAAMQRRLLSLLVHLAINASVIAVIAFEPSGAVPWLIDH